MTALPIGTWPALLQPFGLGALPPGVLVLIVVWTLVWKGLALWRAARAGQTGWFIVLLVVNTVGLLEIVYLLVLSRRTLAVPSSAGGVGPSSTTGALAEPLRPRASAGGGSDARP